MLIRDYLISQFRQPRGIAGVVVGWAMAVKNKPRNAWLVEVVDPRPGDRILEIGFGPGTTLAALAAKVGKGCVAGVDHSAVMVAQARSRNRRAIEAGRVEVRLGSAEALPFERETFDKVCASNVNLFWADELPALREIKRVLRPRGWVVFTLQPRWATSAEQVDATARELEEKFRATGFVGIDIQRKSMRPIACLCAKGVKE